MLGFIIFIILFVVFCIIIEPYSTRLAQFIERKRVERELELERLQEENYQRYYQDYLERKNRKNRKK